MKEFVCGFGKAWPEIKDLPGKGLASLGKQGQKYLVLENGNEVKCEVMRMTIKIALSGDQEESAARRNVMQSPGKDKLTVLVGEDFIFNMCKLLSTLIEKNTPQTTIASGEKWGKVSGKGPSWREQIQISVPSLCELLKTWEEV